MDKQNEGIKDPEDKVIPYDMGGYAAVRSWGKERPVTAKTRRRLVKHAQNIPLSMISGLGECHGLRNNFCEKRKHKKKRINKRKIKIIMGGYQYYCIYQSCYSYDDLYFFRYCSKYFNAR